MSIYEAAQGFKADGEKEMMRPIFNLLGLNYVLDEPEGVVVSDWAFNHDFVAVGDASGPTLTLNLRNWQTQALAPGVVTWQDSTGIPDYNLRRVGPLQLNPKVSMFMGGFLLTVNDGGLNGGAYANAVKVTTRFRYVLGTGLNEKFVHFGTHVRDALRSTDPTVPESRALYGSNTPVSLLCIPRKGVISLDYEYDTAELIIPNPGTGNTALFSFGIVGVATRGQKEHVVKECMKAGRLAIPHVPVGMGWPRMAQLG